MKTLFLMLAAATLYGQRPEPAPYKPTGAEIQAVRDRLSRPPSLSFSSPDVSADVAIYFKAAEWILRHPEEFLTRAYYDNTVKLLDVGMTRAKELEAGKATWTTRTGRVARAYRSKVDGSFQPYAVVAPPGYDPKKPMRLDVILHGRNARLNEVSFLADAEFGKAPAVQPDRIELIIYGRTNNAYRWAGEADVFEALAAVERNYAIDPRKIVLRGFSMGGAGGWHLGLHYPHRWAAVESGAGFSETERYAKREAAPEYEKRVWPIYDAYLYARNGLMTAMVGYGSIDDPQLQAAVNVKEQLTKETYTAADLRALFLVGPRIGHKFAPESKAESEVFLAKALAQPRDAKNVRFLTYTARYGVADWVTIDGLEKHYTRGEVEGSYDGGEVSLKTAGVTRLIVPAVKSVEIDGQSLNKPGTVLQKVKGKWKAAGSDLKLRKRHGLQGPIDDAFLDSFLCVKPTGEARDIGVNQLALRRLETFRANWDKFLRGDVRVKDDKDVSDDDIRNNNLVLFGDPKSNRLMAKVLALAPFKWDAKKVSIGGKSFPGENQMLVAIYPNPLNPQKYVVINSGHTFGEADFKGTNALLYPRLGDWAVLSADGEVKAVGFFDESWR